MCTLDKRGDLFILTITGDDKHRLSPILIDSIRAALNRVKSESESMGPTALITTAQGKFFSNGYDLSWALSDPDPVRAHTKVRPKAMTKKFRLLVAELISLPMPTIAAVTGHASAAGFVLALSHDYLLMQKDHPPTAEALLSVDRRKSPRVFGIPESLCFTTFMVILSQVSDVEPSALDLDLAFLAKYALPGGAQGGRRQQQACRIGFCRFRARVAEWIISISTFSIQQGDLFGSP